MSPEIDGVPRRRGGRRGRGSENPSRTREDDRVFELEIGGASELEIRREREKMRSSRRREQETTLKDWQRQRDLTDAQKHAEQFDVDGD